MVLTVHLLARITAAEISRHKETSKTSQNGTIKQYDGTADTDIESDTDSEEEIDPNSLSNLVAFDYGWSRSKGTICQKEISFCCWVNQTPTEEEEARNAKENDAKDTPDGTTAESQPEAENSDPQSSDGKEREEIYISPTETSRTKILTK